MWVESSLLILAGLLVLLASGMSVGLAMCLAGSAAIVWEVGAESGPLVIAGELSSSLSYTLLAIPLFILMGELLFIGGTARDIFDVASAWLRRLPGGLAVVAVGTGATFGALSGSSVAAIATVGVVTIPQMLDRGYSPRLACGSVAASGGLAQLIPPSVLLVLYASIVEVSVGDILVAGIVPGVLLGFGFLAVAIIWGLMSPDAAPREVTASWSERFRVVTKILRPVLIVVAVTVSILAGIATATEAAALGAATAAIFALAAPGVRLSDLTSAAVGAARTTSFIALIVFGGHLLSWIVSYHHLPRNLLDLVIEADFNKWTVLIMLMLMYILLGMFIDPVGIMVITLPVVAPIVTGLGFDPIWFGVLLVVNLELALITPPLGVGVFMVKGVAPASVSLSDVYKGAWLFGLATMLLILLLVLMPDIALWLPGIVDR